MAKSETKATIDVDAAWDLGSALYALVKQARDRGAQMPEIGSALSVLNGLVLASVYGADTVKIEQALARINKMSLDGAQTFYQHIPRQKPVSH